MNYRFNKQQKLDNKFKKMTKSMEKEETTQVHSDDTFDKETFINESSDEFAEYELKRKDIKNNQYQMNEKNKSKKFDMYNLEGDIRDIYIEMYKKHPLSLAVFTQLCMQKDKQNFCEISQRELAKILESPLSEIEKAMKYLYDKKIVCILNKKDLIDLEFDRKELKQVYFISMRFVWSTSQYNKKYIIDLIPEDFRYKGQFKKFCTLDDHISMNKALTDLARENKRAFGLFFIMAFFMNTKNRYFTSIKGLSKKIKKSPKYVLGLLNVLIEKGFIRQDENCFVINSTVIWNRNQTFTFENDIANILKQKSKRFKKYIKDRHEITLMFLRAKKEMYLENTLHKAFI